MPPRFLTMKNPASTAMIATTTPPITPAAIAPAFEHFFDVDLSVGDVNVEVDALDAPDVLDALGDAVAKRG